MTNKKYVSDYDEIAQQCQALLAYPHAWVRLRAAKIIGQMLSVVDGQELDAMVKSKDHERGFIYCDTVDRLRSLVLDLCAQYTPTVTKDMAEQVSLYYFYLLVLIFNIESSIFFMTVKKLTDQCWLPSCLLAFNY